jgi:methyl-accepting chemotaxis protein
MKIGSLTSAARTALSGIDDVFRQVDDTAHKVAAGVQKEGNPGTDDVSSAIAKMPALKQQAAANARVFETANALLTELTTKPRR